MPSGLVGTIHIQSNFGCRENPYFENWPIFSLCMWKWGESASCGQARRWQPNGTQCAKSHAAWQSLLSRAEELRVFTKKIVLTDLFLVIFFRHFRAVGHFLKAGVLFGGFSSIRATKFNVGCRKTPYFENLADLWQIWPYSRYRGHIRTCSQGRLQGHLWAIKTIGSCSYG